MHTYKLMRSLKSYELEQLQDLLSNPHERSYVQKLLDRSNDQETFREIELKRIMHEIEYQDDCIWGDFKFDQARHYIDADTDQWYIAKWRQSTQFCYFEENNVQYCIQFPDGNPEGRKALRWYFRNCDESKRHILRIIRFPENLITQFMSRNPNVAKRLRVPQSTGTSDYVEVGGTDVARDPLYQAARSRGTDPSRGILYLPANGWQLRITSRGTIQNYQNPKSEMFIRFIRRRILPLI